MIGHTYLYSCVIYNCITCVSLQSLVKSECFFKFTALPLRCHISPSTKKKCEHSETEKIVSFIYMYIYCDEL